MVPKYLFDPETGERRRSGVRSRELGHRGRCVIGHFWEQSDAVCLGGIEFVAGEHRVHCVSPGGITGKPDHRAAEETDSPTSHRLGAYDQQHNTID
jgi:hypothetical protein